MVVLVSVCGTKDTCGKYPVVVHRFPNDVLLLGTLCCTVGTDTSGCSSECNTPSVGWGRRHMCRRLSSLELYMWFLFVKWNFQGNRNKLRNIYIYIPSEADSFVLWSEFELFWTKLIKALKSCAGVTVTGSVRIGGVRCWTRLSSCERRIAMLFCIMSSMAMLMVASNVALNRVDIACWWEAAVRLCCVRNWLKLIKLVAECEMISDVESVSEDCGCGVDARWPWFREFEPDPVRVERCTHCGLKYPFEKDRLRFPNLATAMFLIIALLLGALVVALSSWIKWGGCRPAKRWMRSYVRRIIGELDELTWHGSCVHNCITYIYKPINILLHVYHFI